MNIDDLGLDSDERKLLVTLQSLKSKLDAHTLSRYRRVNPLAENLIDWHEKGEQYAGPESVIYDSATLIGDVAIGDHVWIGEGCMVDGSGGLEIGNHVVLACGVHVYTHDTVKWALTGGLASYKHAPVSIGDCVFVGAQAVIACGVKVGEHALICANATVTKDVPPYAIVAGTPARVIGTVMVDGANVELKYHD